MTLRILSPTATRRQIVLVLSYACVWILCLTHFEEVVQRFHAFPKPECGSFETLPRAPRIVSPLDIIRIGGVPRWTFLPICVWLGHSPIPKQYARSTCTGSPLSTEILARASRAWPSSETWAVNTWWNPGSVCGNSRYGSTGAYFMVKWAQPLLSMYIS
jgi:hypothetical protein